MIILDPNIAIGFMGGAEWLTSVVELSSGAERRNQRRAVASHYYQFEYNFRPIADCRAIKDFHMDVRGMKRTWLLRDFADDTVTDQIVGTGDGVVLTFQAVKNYGIETPYQRIIRHIIPGTMVAKVNGIAVTVADEANGAVLLAVAPTSGAVVTFSYQFYVPVRFTVDRIDIEVGRADASGYGRIPALGAREVLV